MLTLTPPSPPTHPTPPTLHPTQGISGNLQEFLVIGGISRPQVMGNLRTFACHPRSAGELNREITFPSSTIKVGMGEES